MGARVGRVLAPWQVHSGYLLVNLHTANQPHKRPVHLLVAEAFIGPSPTTEHQVNHEDGDKLNNSASNLKWVTPQQNAIHAYAIGLRRPTAGSINGQARLTERQVRQIRKLKGTITQAAIARQYGVSAGYVSAILHGRNWRHVG
jgi:hypothetical protein